MLSAAHIHPLQVHFPIVIVLSRAAIDVFGTLAGKNVTGRSCFGNLSTGLAGLAAAFRLRFAGAGGQRPE